MMLLSSNYCFGKTRAGAPRNQLVKEIHMSTPKMLPWLAGTSGIPLERAEALWQSAIDYAASITGESESARFLSLAREHMVALVEKEMLVSRPIADAPWLMIQAHVSVAPMLLADLFEQASVATRNLLSRFTSRHTDQVA